MDDSPPERREDRGPKIPAAKVKDIKPNPSISIFYKTEKNSTLQCIERNFPRDAAMIFCDRIRHELMENNSKSFTVTGGDLNGLKDVIAWIKECVQAQDLIKFKELDFEQPNLFLTYANVIISATHLGIPARDLSEGLTKRLFGIARKVLMSWDEVDFFLYSPALENCNEQIRDVATASIFWGWWNAKLTDEDTPDDMDILYDLRQKDKKLDEDLHVWCTRNQEEVEKKWAEKKAKKAAEQAGVAGEGWNNDGVAAVGDAGIGGGWDTVDAGASAAPQATGGWDDATGANNPSTPPGASSWNNTTAASGPQPLPASGNTCTNNIVTAPIARQPVYNLDAADKAWDSGVDVAANTTGENTPATCDSSSIFTAEDNTTVDGRAKYNTGSLGGFDSNEDSGNWADEVNSHDQYVNQSW